ncbi:Xaa-Pro dipeptidyl-peptidase [Amycolatopsis keratiniphila]|uniref:Xaa-Pro dipeptidyl-peptidase n=1 Tax=Amycolatopsis keratiniphila subsp. keratiniphila TaxID=227715 RepID=A0A1W2LXC6_9PSEU|nr:Xaa-Pro dipeptidyl-peptidase [Amycolatopsis keratiniphila]OLZ48616.1 Xaa-Pro dipeptidyl-peptidase [Amycolatopsis keratiniphila subsp. nogabecina]ONF71573.1 Xaa-Pro dipeptidyl-peptidase [Amycolatopsis keratiniphila subsp. keratiniphila]SDU36151.1 X-Pro dipeptidyl-peptidase [Amycolatopsis keratiniphila]
MRVARLAALFTAVLVLPATALPAQADAPPAPVFKDGQAQPVFDPADVIRENVWVTAPVDSDHDGKDDLVHAEVVRPRATQQGMKVPVVYQASPYYAGGNDVANHNVDVELYVPGAKRAPAGPRIATKTVGPNAAPISWRYQDYFTARGFAVVYGESLGSGQSTGCPSTGDVNETIGAKSIVDWLNGRATARDAAGKAAVADWSTGKTGMTGVSYNGTLPNAVASTGVEGLETIVPIAAISSWYDYYRNDGAVVAAGGFQGEDADVLADYVYTRQDRAVCRPLIDRIGVDQDRVTGDYSRFWDVRNYRNDVNKVRASVLVVHGLGDWNVKTDQGTRWYEMLKARGVEHKIWLHQAGHADPYSLRRDVWLATLNKWMSHYLYGIDNGIEREPKATIQREDKSWVDEPEWPLPGTQDVKLYPWPGGSSKGKLDTRNPVPGKAAVETLADDASKTIEQLAAAASSGNRLLYSTTAAKQPVRLSGTVKTDLSLSFDKPAANVTAVLLDRAPDGTAKVITRGWTDPQNRRDPARTDPITPGENYKVEVELVAKDYLLAAGHKIEFLVASSDHDYTLRPKPGAGVSVELNRTSLVLPVAGGKPALRAAFG